MADPENACADMEPAPAYDSDQYLSYALISTTVDPINCTVREKVQNLRQAGYDGAVLYFSDPKDPKEPKDENEGQSEKLQKFKKQGTHTVKDCAAFVTSVTEVL